MASHSQALQGPSEKPARIRTYSLTALASVIAVTVLVGSEALVVAFASVWAMPGMFHPAEAVMWALYGLASIGAILAAGWFARLAWTSEMQPASPKPSEVEAG